MHAAVIAINDAIDHQVADGTLEALRNPSAHLVDVAPDNSESYQSALYQAKSTKAAQALAKVTLCSCFSHENTPPFFGHNNLLHAEMRSSLEFLWSTLDIASCKL